jgi:hypothetical protein
MGVAFLASFSAFVLCIVVIAFLAVRWAVGRDRAERARRAAETDASAGRCDPQVPASRLAPTPPPPDGPSARPHRHHR